MHDTINGAMFKEMLLFGTVSIAQAQQAINDLNVFPVPDGDTGTNMSLTIQTAAQELKKIEPATVDQAASVTASALLRGARGNSGVILSLLFRGISKELKGCMPRTKGDRPDVIPDGCVNFAFLGQFADTPRDTVFTTEYSVRTAMEAVYGLLGVDRGVPEVWGSVYDIRELLDSSVKLMDGKSPLDIQLPGPLNALKKPLLHVIHGTVVEKVLQDHDIIR